MDNRGVKIGLVVAMTVLLVLTLVFNYLSTSEIGRTSGLFENKNNSYLPWNQRGNIRDCGITPPGWAFTIWAVIYVYQFAMLGYTWSLLFRKNSEDDEYLCCVDGLLPTSALALHSATSVFNIAWVFLADRIDSTVSMVVPQTFAIVLLAVAMGFVVGLSYHGIVKAANNGLSQMEFRLSVALWLNANGLYLGWVTVASYLNIDIAIINMSNWLVDQGDVLSLANVVLLLAVYSTLDLTCLKLHLLFTPYVSALWALATSVGKNFGPQKAASVITIEAAVALVLVLVVKMVLAVVHTKCSAVKPLPQSRPASADSTPAKSALP